MFGEVFDMFIGDEGPCISSFIRIESVVFLPAPLITARRGWIERRKNMWPSWYLILGKRQRGLVS